MIYNSLNFHHNTEKRLNVSLFEALSLYVNIDPFVQL